jgi:hypothetical protein
MNWRKAGDASPHELIREDRDFEKTRRWVVCESDFASKATSGLCLHPSIASDCMDSWMERCTKECPTDGVYSTCDEERGHLVTGEKFGCIHFEGRGE